MGDVTDQRNAGSHWVTSVEEDAASSSGPAAVAEPGRWLVDQPRAQAFVPSRREATAVDTYCAELCPTSEAAAASGEILETFTGAGPADLLRHTRVVAAQHTAAGRVRSRIWRRRDQACDSTPALLAARANNTLGDAESAKLDAHVSSCLSCQALELRSQRAERAFAAILAAGIERDVTATMPAVSDVPPALAAAVVNTARWIPDADSAPATPAEPEDALQEAPVDPHARRRRLVGAVLTCAAVVAATIAAIVLITGSSNSHHVASSRLAAVHSAPRAHVAARHTAAKSHARAHKHAAVVHRSRHAKPHRAATTAAAVASPPPAVTTTPVVSTPPTTPVSTPPSQPSTPAPQPTVSIQQPSLGAVNAPTQKIGSK